MLQTDLEHIETQKQFEELIADNERVALCCGRMGPMCIPVYGIFEVLRDRYPDIVFCDMDFDVSVASTIRNLPECRGFQGLPFTVYFRNGKVMKATSSIRSADEVKADIREVFA